MKPVPGPGKGSDPMNPTAACWILFAILLLAVGGFLFLVAPGRVDKSRYPWLIGHCFAHRGLYTADQSVPENSLPAFSRAVEAGYGIELDVALTSDGRLVVFHDDTLQRMTGENGKIWEISYPELERLSLAGTTQKVPLFTDVLRRIDGRVPLIVEIKNGPRPDMACSMTYDLLKGYNGRYCMESFNPFMVAWFRRHAPQVLRGQLSMRYGESEHIPGIQKFLLGNLLLNCVSRPQFIAYRHEDCGRFPFRLCRRLGAIAVAWTVRSGQALAGLGTRYDAFIFEHFDPEGRTEQRAKTVS